MFGYRQHERRSGHDGIGYLAFGVLRKLQSVILRFRRNGRRGCVLSGELFRKRRHIRRKFVKVRDPYLVLYYQSVRQKVGKVGKEVYVVLAGLFIQNAHDRHAHDVAVEVRVIPVVQEQREFQIHYIGNIEYRFYSVINRTAEGGFIVFDIRIQHLENQRNVEKRLVTHRRHFLVVELGQMLLKLVGRESVFLAVILPLFGEHLLTYPHHLILGGGLVEHLRNFVEHFDKGVVITLSEARLFVTGLPFGGDFTGNLSRKRYADGIQLLNDAVFVQIGNRHRGGVDTQRQSEDGGFERYFSLSRSVFAAFPCGAIGFFPQADSEIDLERAQPRFQTDFEAEAVKVASEVDAESGKQSHQEVLCKRQRQPAVRQYQGDIGIDDFVCRHLALRKHRCVGNVARFAAVGDVGDEFADELARILYLDMVK